MTSTSHQHRAPSQSSARASAAHAAWVAISVVLGILLTARAMGPAAHAQAVACTEAIAVDGHCDLLLPGYALRLPVGWEPEPTSPLGDDQVAFTATDGLAQLTVTLRQDGPVDPFAVLRARVTASVSDPAHQQPVVGLGGHGVEVPVAGADAAAAAVLSYLDEDGLDMLESWLVAVRGSRVYEVRVTAYVGYLTQHPGARDLLTSFTVVA